ncbi:calcium channel [Rhodotorula toruloides]|uniref:Voltage-gated hydrogen channel 1 n=1 Tax=Rhodotorula toruloides TaxID=5286 RepID=A0A511K904_RHOTO|nr:calcium channel [Rhodotorula toruloides]
MGDREPLLKPAAPRPAPPPAGSRSSSSLRPGRRRAAGHGEENAGASVDAESQSTKCLSGFSRFRQKLGETLKQSWVEWTILALCLIDFAISMTQISYFFIRDTTCECTDSCPPDPPILEFCDLLSLMITGAFVVEILMDLTAFGPSYYLTDRFHWLHSADAVVILVAFVLEVVLKGTEKQIASLITILRLWRLIKLVSSAEVSLTEYEEMAVYEREREAWEEERRGLEREKRGLEGEVRALRRRVREMEDDEEERERSRLL